MADDMDIIVPLRCSNCGGLNPPDAKRCQFCSASLVGAAPASLTPLPPLNFDEAAPDFLNRPPEPTPAASVAAASPFTAAPPPPAAISATEIVPPPAAATPPPARGSLASRLGTNPPPPASNDSLGGLGNLRSGLEVTNPTDRPQTGELEGGFVVPAVPTASPFRREEPQAARPRNSESTVDWLASLRASSTLPEDEEADAEEPELLADNWLNRMRTVEPTYPAPVVPTPAAPPIAPPSFTPATPAPSAPAAPAEEISQPLPDWLRSLRLDDEPAAPQSAQPSLPFVAPPAATPRQRPQSAELPSWLVSEPTGVKPLTGDLPPWLVETNLNAPPAASNVPAWLQGSSLAPAPAAPPFSEPPADDLPAWLSGNEAATPPLLTLDLPTPAPATANEGVGLLGNVDAPWLQQLAAQPLPERLPESNRDTDPLAGFGAGIFDRDRSADRSAFDSDSFLDGLDDADGRESGGAATMPADIATFVDADPRAEAGANLPAEIADFVADGRATPGVAALPHNAAVDDDTPPWLLGETEAAATLTNESALAATPAHTAEDEEAEPTEAAPPVRPRQTGLINEQDVPAWLRAQLAEQEQQQVRLPRSPGRANPPANPTPALTADGSGYVPNWLRNLGTSDEDAAAHAVAAAEAAASVAQQTAVIAPGAPKINRDMSVRSPRTGAAEAFAELVTSPSSATLTSSVLRGERKQSNLRWLTADRIIYLLTALLVVTAYVLGRGLDGGAQGGPLGNLVKPVVSTAVSNYYTAIEQLPTDASVLVAMDWDADRQAELEPLAYATLRHLFEGGRRVHTISLLPSGSAFAGQVLTRASNDYNAATTTRQVSDGQQFVNLGYLPGGEVGLRALAGRNQFTASFASRADFGGRPLSGLPVLNGINRLSDYRAIILLEGDEGIARQWAEQLLAAGFRPPAASDRTSTRLLIGYSAVAQPTVNLYLDPHLGSRLLFSGSVAGLMGSSQYEQELGNRGKTFATNLRLFDRLNVLSFALIFIVILILIGNAVMISRAVSNRR